MRRWLWAAGILFSALAIVIAGFLIWAYRPVPTFRPLAYSPVRVDYWPTEGWRISTPEAQGMDSEALLEMIDFCTAQSAANPEFYLDSVTVIRNGHIVAEFYPNPNYSPDKLHVIHSATKSIVSALVGIAIEQGLIESVDAKVVDFFPERTFDNMNESKRSMTIRDLLTMQTGMHSRDSYLYAHEGLLALQQSRDWLQYALGLPMAAKPGERFDYSNVSTFLLGAILAKATGTGVLTFAREALFKPLGISDIRWEWTEGGLPIAWARMWLKPDDLAKIGLLYLQQGRWDDQQVIPAAWIRESLTPWAFPKNAVDILNSDMSRNRDASTQNWVAQRFVRPFADGYGYQWWLDHAGNYTALGTNGQYLAVSPANNLIFVVTSKSSGISQFKPATLFYDYVLPAIEADTPLPDNARASNTLAAYATAPEHKSTATQVPYLPPIAMEVAGITYRMERNPYKTDNVRFMFDAAKPYAELSYTARESWAPSYRIGLDGVPRTTGINDGIFVASGEWTTPDTFSVNVEIVGYTTFDRWEFRFVDDSLFVTEYSITGDYTYAGKADPD
ncbi:MAG: serine hydrolase [Hyphomicrobiales bacterium]|nr:serine hydrolase [Hyphomicrobiales bacterium]